MPTETPQEIADRIAAKALPEPCEFIDAWGILPCTSLEKPCEPCARRVAVSAAFLPLVEALEKSVELQSHYASCLNVLDGGERMLFVDAKAWRDRLKALAAAAEEVKGE